MAFVRTIASCTLLYCCISRLVGAQSNPGSISSGYDPQPGQIKNLVTFGDSYTVVVEAGDNGTAWPVFAAADGSFQLHPFAQAGATCSNNLTNKPSPSVFEGQLPLYFKETSNGSLSLNSYETMYTLWIGTNDVGVGALLTGEQTPGVTLANTVSCAVNWVKALYANGARNFLFQNMLPLQETIMYSFKTYPNRYWTYEHNATEWYIMMSEITQVANNMSYLMLEALAPQLPGAHIGYFRSYDFISDILAHPGSYLNGTAPYNTTGCINSCVFPLNANTTNNTGDCTIAQGAARDSFVWYDELHPSQITDFWIGKAVANAVSKASEAWVTWLS